MLDANTEMGQAEMPDINEMVQDPAAVEEYLNNGDCMVIQDQ